MMLIASPDTGLIVNTDNIVDMFVGMDGKIVVRDVTGKSCPVASYSSDRMAHEAIKWLAENLRSVPDSRTLVYMPTAEDIKLKLESQKPPKARYEGGKKTKSHGGS